MPLKLCHFCGDQFYTRATKVDFCSRKCYELSRQRKKKTCEFCGVTFTPHNKQQRFCSVNCRGKRRDSKSIFTCEWCGKTFKEWTYRAPRFCSRDCMSRYAAHQPKGKRAERVTVCCDYCGMDYLVLKRYYEARGSRFCSKECVYKWNSENVVGEKHPQYIGGTRFPNRGSNWLSQRRKALKRDGYSCQICDRKAKKGEKRVVSVHHIKPYRLFDGDYLMANDLSNLITLCRKCHTLVEDYGYPCPQPLL